MKTVQMTMAVLLISSMGSVFAAEGGQMLQDQQRIGDMGDKYHQQMEQKREQFRNEYRYQHREQAMQGRAELRQERRMNRTR